MGLDQRAVRGRCTREKSPDLAACIAGLLVDIYGY